MHISACNMENQGRDQSDYFVEEKKKTHQVHNSLSLHVWIVLQLNTAFLHPLSVMQCKCEGLGDLT